MKHSAAILILGTLATVACGKPALEEAATSAAVPVTVEAARVDTIQAVISVSGTVTPAPGADWIITAPEPARIAELLKAEGDTVAMGDVLVRFDIPTLAADVSAKRAGVAQAMARLDLAKASVARLSGLVTQGVAARREVDEAKREQLDAEAALTQAQSAAEAAAALADRAVVRARFAGIVAKRWHNAGDFVEASASDPVLRIINPARLQVVAAVPVTELARMQTGRTATIIGPAGGDGEAAVVSARSGQVDTGSATADIRLTFSTPTTLTAGTAVQIDIVAEAHKGAILVDAAAVVRDGDEVFVFVVTDDKAHKRPVTLGITTRTLVEIKTGVKAGEQVITEGHDGLPDGAAVTVAK